MCLWDVGLCQFGGGVCLRDVGLCQFGGGFVPMEGVDFMFYNMIWLKNGVLCYITYKIIWSSRKKALPLQSFSERGDIAAV